MNGKEAIAPKGVRLLEPNDFEAHRNLIYDTAIDTVRSVFPLEHKNSVLTLDDLEYVESAEEPTPDTQNKIKLTKGYLARRLRGTFTLKDKESGKVLDKRKMSIMRVPTLTSRGTFLHKGSDYNSIKQQRLMPGVYIRRKGNGVMEAQFNVLRGTGAPFKTELEPETGIFKLVTGQSNSSLYSVLHDIGVSDKTLERSWGPELLEMNKKKYNKRAIDTAFKKLPNYKLRKKYEDSGGKMTKEDVVREALGGVQVSEYVVKHTLPGFLDVRRVGGVSEKLAQALCKTAAGAVFPHEEEPTKDEFGDTYIPIGVDGVIRSTQQILEVKGDDVEDVRDQLQYKRLYRTHNMLKERITLDAGGLRRKAMWGVDKSKTLKSLPPFFMDNYVKDLLIGNSLSSPTEETNPLLLEDQGRRITMMGDGGIGSSSAITDEAQAVNPTTFGFISPLEGPESEKAGVDVRIASGAKLGDDGKIYQVYHDKRTGKDRWMSAADLKGLVVKLPE